MTSPHWWQPSRPTPPEPSTSQADESNVEQADTDPGAAGSTRVVGAGNRVAGASAHHNVFGDVTYHYYAAQSGDKTLPTDVPKPLPAWTADQLHVHPSISGTTQAAAGFVLPAYVERPHDIELRQHLKTAAAGDRPVLVVVRAGSCTGKTRSAYQALQSLPDLETWSLVFPRTAASAMHTLRVGNIMPRTVIWLDDAHRLLDGPEGEALAGVLSSKLAGPNPRISGITGLGFYVPALYVATIWSTAYTTLTAPCSDPNGEDAHWYARTLLAGAIKVDVPASFDDKALESAGASGDPALATARESTRNGMITQTLAAGLELIDRYSAAYDPPACYTRALVTAAMDATRLGWDAPLPHAFLEEAAPAYVTDHQRSQADPERWFPQALQEARAKIHKVASALEPVSPPSGMGQLPGLSRLTDYLDAHGRASRRSLCPPPVFWSAAARHATAPDHLTHLSEAAGQRRRFEAAEHLARLAAVAGDPRAYRRLGGYRAMAGEHEEAERLYQLAIAAGARDAYHDIMSIRARVGDWSGALEVLQPAVAVGMPQGYSGLAMIRERHGDRDGAQHYYQQAAATGDSWSYVKLAEMKQADGDPAEAERLLHVAAQGAHYGVDPGQTINAYRALSQMSESSGDHTEAERLARESASLGDGVPYLQLARVRESEGSHGEAERFTLLAADAGAAGARTALAEMRERPDDQAGNEQRYLLAAAAGEPNAYTALSRVREEAGDRQGAEHFARLAAEAGHPYAYRELGKAREKTGEYDEGERLYQLAADAGHPLAYANIAQLRDRIDDPEGAEEIARRGVDAGQPYAYSELLRTRQEAGDPAGIERLRRMEFL